MSSEDDSSLLYAISLHVCNTVSHLMLTSAILCVLISSAVAGGNMYVNK